MSALLSELAICCATASSYSVKGTCETLDADVSDFFIVLERQATGADVFPLVRRVFWKMMA